MVGKGAWRDRVDLYGGWESLQDIQRKEVFITQRRRGEGLRRGTKADKKTWVNGAQKPEVKGRVGRAGRSRKKDLTFKKVKRSQLKLKGHQGEI